MRYRLLLFSLLLGLVWWGSSTGTEAWAHGGGQAQIVGGLLGPYRVNIWTSPEPPRVGTVHFTVAVYQPGERSDSPITHAEVNLILTHEGGEQLRTPVELTEAYPYYYEADLPLTQPGEWRADVLIKTPEASGTFTFNLQVQPASRVSPLLWSGMILVGMVLLWWFFGGKTHGKHG